jgi:hypothetical protein
MASYAVELTDPFGHHVGNLDWLSFDCSRALNTLGNATFTFSGNYPIGFFRKNQRIKLHRHTNKGGYLVGRTVWFVTQFTYNDDDHIWTVRAEDTMKILNNPIVAYLADTVYADKTFDNENEGTADDLMKEYVRENLGADVTDSFRDESANLTVEAGTHEGGFTEKQASYRKLLSVCQELADDSAGTGIEVYFDVTFVENANPQFIFITRVGDLYGNRSSLLTFYKGNGTVERAELTWDYSKEITYGYVGGDGEGAERVVLEINSGLDSGAPFERSEELYDARGAYATTALYAEGRTQLQKSQGILSITANLKETNEIKFGHDFDFGQKVGLSVKGYMVEALIDKFSIQAERGGADQLDISVKGSVKDMLYSFVTVPGVPDAPVLTVSNPTVSTLEISWTGTVSETYTSGYVLERSLDGIAFDRLYTAPVTEITYIDGGLTTATQYYYRVKAYSTMGYSDYSNIDSDTTL